jgi:tetratricopeptide (TPR) repeat protein
MPSGLNLHVENLNTKVMTIEWIEKYLNEAEQMIYNDQLEQAMAVTNNLLFEEPGYGRLHNHLGWAHMYYTSDLEKAALHFNMAMKFEESFAAPYQHMGHLSMRNGKYADAIGYFELGLTKNNPNSVALLEGIGQAYELQKEYRKAIKAYKAAILASVADQEVITLNAGIKRCRNKRIALFFAF